MKTITSLLCGLLLLGLTSSCGQREVYLFTSFHEPADEGLRLLYSYDGKQWADLGRTFLSPKVGMEIMRDPSMAQGSDGTFHLVWTSGWKDDRGFGHASSDDLITWSEQQYVEVMAHEPEAVNVWAPEIFFDADSDRFIIVWATTIPFRFERGIEAEDNNHRLYYTTTKDFQTFSEAKLFLDLGYSVIDAVIYQRGKADYVLVLKDNTRPNRNIRVAFGASPLGPFSEPSASITPAYTEGPTVAKVDTEHYIYFDSYRDKTYGAVKTTDFVTFVDTALNVSFPEGHKHGSVFMVKESVLNKLMEYSKKK
ncbi:MAG: glycoside hydrolase family 43 protein [Prevotellaceae bacterium]|jgi:hypothetical protein|nr:glycoside hydrolase family 43 protein [Prevotellaceae bacterium]